MRLTFSWPTTAQFGGGVDAVFQWANAMARRGHDVHVIHGPRTDDRIDSLDEVTWFRYEPTITHEILDRFDDTAHDSDVFFQFGGPPRLGQPAVIVQGYKLLAARFERPAYRAACPKFCVATWLFDIAEAWGSPREQVFHLPVGLDPLFHDAAPTGDRPLDVAMLYTKHPVKGAAQGLAALVELRRRRPDLEVGLFGYDGRTEHLPDWARYVVRPDRRRLRDELLGRAKVFLQPARREGFGLTPVEALASGCALVSTDNGGSRDYAFDGETALIVPYDDPGATADAIAALLDHPAERDRLAAAGKEVSRRFDWDRAAGLLEGHLERYLADPAALQHPPADAPMFLDESL